MGRVRVVAPATSANLGAGFDVFGLALDRPADVLVVEEIEAGVEMVVEGFPVPETPEANVAGYVAKRLAENAGAGVRLELRKGVPPGSGLGSSAASAVASAAGVAVLLGLEVGMRELLGVCAEAEGVASGAPHADNAAACLYGGFVCVGEEMRVLRVEPPEWLEWGVVLPEVRVETREARRALPERVPLDVHVHSLGSVVMMVAGMMRGERELVRLGMRDRFATPVRSRWIPRFEEVVRAVVEAGALGVTVSGSGPACIALCSGDVCSGEEVAEAMGEVYSEAGVECRCFWGKPGGGVEVEGRRLSNILKG